MTITPTPLLQPGDALLYFTRCALDYAIAIKTWTKIAHIEVYVGDKMSVASRNGVGVNFYSLRLEGLQVVRRPNISMGGLNLVAARTWFNSVQGQKYDWKGLLCFTLAVAQGSKDKMFCSEFATRYYRAGGGVPFDVDLNADRVAPAQFLQTPAFNTIWKAP